MADTEGSSFEVDRLAAVDAQIRALAERARNAGLLGQFLECMNRIVAQLRGQPLTWGDPLYHTKKEGGTVYRGIERLVVVQYVVFADERLVCLLKIDPLPGAWPH
jgi:hypothetical protein